MWTEVRRKEPDMEQAKRVLIIGMTAEKGGRETFIMELYRRIDRSQIQFDFITTSRGKPIACQEEILNLGGRIYYIPIIRRGPIAHFVRLHFLFVQNHYSAVYYHANGRLKNDDIFRLAAAYRVPIRILHSHNTADLNPMSAVRKFREYCAMKSVNRYLTHRFSCSQGAGEWMFGKDADFTVINNGIDTARFDFQQEVRAQIRAHYDAGGKVIYGTVARFFREKNPLFLIEIFAEIHKRQPGSIFWHIGGGEKMEPELRAKIAELGLEDSYLLLGRKENVEDYLCGMDFFLLPSIYEGFPITLVEAQTSGLHCLVSDSVTADVNITGNVQFLSLQRSPAEWAEEAIKLATYQRCTCRNLMTERGYDVNEIVRDFEHLINGH